MPIRIECPGCGTAMNAPDGTAGKSGKCPKCGRLVKVPVPEDHLGEVVLQVAPPDRRPGWLWPLVIIGAGIFIFLFAIGVEVSIKNQKHRDRFAARCAWANERAAISHMRTIATSELSYKTTEGSNCFGTLEEMSGTAPPFIDSMLGSGEDMGYTFNLQVSPDGQRFACRASPIRPETGNLYFWTDTSGVIREGDKRVNGQSPPQEDRSPPPMSDDDWPEP